MFSTYTQEGCFYECNAENIVKVCGCRPAGYNGKRYLKLEVTAAIKTI